MFVVGLTGGIASGKSTVARMFEEAGVPVICTDELAHEVVKAGSRALREIESAFGPDVIGRDGELDRSAMAGAVFQDESKRKVLESIIHPRIAEEMERRKLELAQTGHGMVVVDVPLLYEVGWEKMCDAVVVVFAKPSDQERRLTDRDGLSPEGVRFRIGAQASIEEKAKAADYVIDNTGSLEQTLSQVQETLKQLQLKAGRRSNKESD
jgi:dephospho-CoA kinase